MEESIKTYLKHTYKDFKYRSVNPPLVRTSTMVFKSMTDLRQVQKKNQKNPRGGYFEYGRQGTITTHELEKILTKLEESYHTFLTPTGFGSVFLALFSVLRPGDEIIISDPIYSPTRQLTENYLKEFNIDTKFYDPKNLNTIKENFTKKTKLIYVENPGSNTFEFQDLKKIISFAKKNKIFTAIDNTWGTPYFLKPVKVGFDLSIVSATKYYSGHSDVMGGSLAVSKRVFKNVMMAQNMTGLRLSPDDAYFIMRGIRTLDVRLDKHEYNAIKIAKFLSKKKNIKVLYPHKKNTKNYKLWRKYYSGSSGLMGLKITAKNKKNIDKFVNSLNLFGHGYSWGGYESLALHQEIKEQGKRKYLNLNKNEYIVRLHVGLEDINDLLKDISNSLKYLK